MLNVPIIDIQALFSKNIQDWTTVVAQIDKTLRESGFFYVTNHGVSEHETNTIMQCAKDLFALPDHQKNTLGRTPTNHLGYSAIATEQLEESRPADFNESYNMGRRTAENQHLPGSDLYGVDQFPPINGWSEKVVAYYDAMLELARRILQAMAVALEQPTDFFDPCLKDSMAVLRLLHYPPSAQRSHADQIGAGAHSDYGLLTILFQDNIGGLQAQATDGTWINVPPVPNSFVINIGDMMARWTNDRYRATVHRVHNEVPADRYSMPFFVEPNYNTVVETFASCLKPGEKSKYPTVKSGEWLLERIRETYGD